MDFTILLVLVVLTTAQITSLHHDCNSDVYLPASGMADLHHNTTLQYCHIDNCTIVRIDTGQQLDVIYITQSLLVVIPTDGQTSMIIFKNEPQVFCSISKTTDNSTIIQIIIAIVVAMVSGYIAAAHMIFKKLCSIFGKLIMLYNIAVVLQSANFFAILITHHYIAVHSKILCYLFNSMFMQSVVVSEAFSTCLLALGKLLLSDIFILSYDFGTGTYQYALLPNGHCSNLIKTDNDTVLQQYVMFLMLIQLLKAY